MTARVRFSFHSAYLNTDFGLSYACRVFGKTPEEIEALVGRFVRGKRKGQLRGQLHWHKTVKGGWWKIGQYDDGTGGSGFVAKPNVTFGHGITLYDGTVVFGHDKCLEARHYLEEIELRAAKTETVAA